MTYLRTKAIYFVLLPGLILLSTAGIYSSLGIAIATRNSLALALSGRSTAVLTIPWSAEYQVRLADLRRAAGLPFTNNLGNAVRSSPADSRLWIQLGLAQEQDGDFKSAEASLLRAGTLARDYDTRWTLTNFYFRRSDRDRAVAWACAVLSIPGVEAGPVFSLLANFPAKPDCILRDSFSGPQSARLGYLQWLISRAELDAAGPIANMLTRERDPEAVPALLDYCDRLLLAGKSQLAVHVWNSMSDHGLVSAPVLANGTLMDGGMKLADPSHGFAWRTPLIVGVDLEPLHPGLEISLSGTQPDRCELLSQWVLLGSGLAHALRCRFVSSGIAAGSAVHWNVTTSVGVNLSDIAHPEPGAELYDRNDSEAAIRFKGPPNGNLVRVALVYERAPGAAPTRGWIRLEKIWLTE